VGVVVVLLVGAFGGCLRWVPSVDAFGG
jgi:hypothetical protein